MTPGCSNDRNDRSSPGVIEVASKALGDEEKADLDIVPSDVDEALFLSLSNSSSGQKSDIPIKILRSKTDKVRMVYGDKVKIPLADLGCTLSDPAENARCAMESLKASFGIGNVSDELALVNVRTSSRGDTVVLFSQTFAGQDVFAGHLSIRITPQGEIIQIYSTMSTPLTGPTYAEIDSAQQNADTQTALTELEAKNPSSGLLQVDSGEPILFARLEGDHYVAVPAVSVRTSGVDTGRMEALGIFDAATSELLDSRTLRNDYPVGKLYGTALFADMDAHSYHPECTTDSDCVSYPNYDCSTHFTPKRCVNKCGSDSDCASYGYKCFIPPDLGALEGYCYKDPKGSASELLIAQGYEGTASWYNTSLADHKAYSRLVDSLQGVIEHHYYDMNINGWDNNGSPYRVHFITEDSEGPNSGRGAWNTGSDVYYSGWYSSWSGTSNGAVHGQEHTMGHEWSHAMMGAACGWCDPPAAVHCLHEGRTVQFGELYVAKRLPPDAMWNEAYCGAQTGVYIDDRSGLGNAQSCQYRYLPYAHRSRFDWLSCNVTNPWWGNTCTDDSDCPTYTICAEHPAGGFRCSDTIWKDGHGHYNQSAVMTRLLRIMALGPSAFAADQYPQDIGIADRPIGWATTVRIIHDANTQVSTGTTLKDWMNSLLTAAATYGKYSETVDALGASGFFPNTDIIASYQTDRTPTKVMFSKHVGSDNKEFVFWKQAGTGYIKYLYHTGSGTSTYTITSVNTNTRPVVVEWGYYLHVFYRDATSGAIKVYVIHADGSRFGPYTLRSEFTPNGDFDAVAFNGYLYLVFADSSNDSYLTVAKCSAAVCTQPFSWYDFGSGIYKKVIKYSFSYAPGLSVAAANRVNGLSSFLCNTFNNYLFIAAARQTNKRLQILRMGTNDLVLSPSYSYPSHFPSYTTDSTVGLTVRDSAFDQYCLLGLNVVKTPRRYLYLVWKEEAGNRLFTSVLQNASESDSWITISVDTLSEAKTGTGATWVRSLTPSQNQKIVKVNLSGSIEQLNGYGKY